jgi:hypothetical protein
MNIGNVQNAPNGRACELAETILNENRSALSCRDGAFLNVEILDEYEEGDAAAEAT